MPPDRQPPGDSFSDEALRSLPKAELHVHLDGSLRPGTLLALARERGVPMPAEDEESLARYMVVDDAASLEEYLQRFAVTLSVMQDAEALERIAYETVLDHAAEGVRYVEVRFCPALNTRMGLTPAEALDAAIAGMRRAGSESSVQSNVIVCALRSHEALRSLEMAELAIAYHGQGVCGFDIAGAEAGHPVVDHLAAFDRAAAAGVPITIHAGEGFGPPSIRQALDVGHARRIGHGTRLAEDPDLLERIRSTEIPLEVCLTSNVQTRVVRSLADHPAGRYVALGIPVSIGTDNRLMSGVTLVDEYRHARDEVGLTRAQLTTVARAGFEHAFVDEATRRALLDAFDTWSAELLDEGAGHD